MSKTKMRILVTFLSILSFIVTSTACQDKTDSVKGVNAKLSSELNQLVQAESSGNATSFAQQHNIQLIDNKVRVVIEVLPGQTDNVTKAVDAVGTIETSYQNLLQVLVPVKSLTALSEQSGISLIRLPLQPLPNTFSGSVQ